jgi:hypothetical protein
VQFDPQNPTLTDPSLEDKYPNDYAWGVSEEPNAYYAWAQPIASEVKFHSADPLCLQLRNGVEFWTYYGSSRQELLYRIKFTAEMPLRIRIFPQPYCLFWSFGTRGGTSRFVIYHHKDKYLTLSEWADKNSYLAVLRQQLYAHPENTTFWSR